MTAKLYKDMALKLIPDYVTGRLLIANNVACALEDVGKGAGINAIEEGKIRDRITGPGMLSITLLDVVAVLHQFVWGNNEEASYQYAAEFLEARAQFLSRKEGNPESQDTVKERKDHNAEKDPLSDTASDAGGCRLHSPV